MDNNLNPNTENQSNKSADNYIISEGFMLDTSTDDSKALKRKKSNKKGCLGAGIWIGIIFLISAVIAAFIIILSFDYLGIGRGSEKTVLVDIEKGMSGKQIAQKLEDADAINNAFMFRMYSKIKGYESDYKYGVYTFSNELGYDDIANKLQKEGAKAQSVTVTIPEMASVDDIAKILDEAGVCTVADFKSAVKNAELGFEIAKDIPTKSVYYRLEGYLFPDTYDFYSYDSKECARLAVEKMVRTMDERFDADMRKKASDMGYSIHEILTMASIVELEAGGSPSEMSNVAAVFYNRLNWDEPKFLGSSPTMDYPHGNGRYDTNKNEGLPPGPLCSPSLNSIKAALNPTENFEYTYFVTDKVMKFYYNKTLAEHKATIKKLKADKNWLG